MTTKTKPLTSTQTEVLSAAAADPNGHLTCYPPNVKGGAQTKVNMALERAGLAKWNAKAQCFMITPAGRAAIGGAVPAPTMVDATAPAEAPTAQPDAPEGQELAAKPKRTRENSKQATVVAMLQRPEGATIAQICASMGWLPHTARGLLAGALKKKLGLTIVSEKAKGGERVYRIA